MDENDVQKLQTIHKFNKYQFFKMTLQFALSVSLFLLVLFYSSVFCFFAHCFNIYFPTFIFSLFNHTLETKYMFLVCNGILVILAKSSASGGSSSSSDQSYLGSEDPASELSEMKATVVDEEVPLESIKPLEHVTLVAEREQEQVPETEEQEEEDEEIKEEESVVLVKSEDDQEEEEPEAANEELPSTDESNIKIEEFIRNEKEEEEEMKEEESGVLVKSEDDQEEEPESANEELPCTDELNQKFEDFIRKMKEEIRIEGITV